MIHAVTLSKSDVCMSMSQQVKADLRTHHFSFGNDQPIRRTASQEAYVPMKGPRLSLRSRLLSCGVSEIFMAV